MLTPEILLDAVGNVKEEYIAEAKNKKSIIKKFFTYSSVAAACMIIFVLIINIPNFQGMKAEGGDTFRNGFHIENIQISDLTENYNGKLLAENIVGDNYFEFYSKTEEFSENSENWYSLIFSERNEEYKLLMHCMFGEKAEDWKIDMVFTDKATQTVTTNGTEVEIARFDLSFEYTYCYYALFEYDGTVYDLRINSDNEDTVFMILNRLIK